MGLLGLYLVAAAVLGILGMGLAWEGVVMLATGVGLIAGSLWWAGHRD